MRSEGVWLLVGLLACGPVPSNPVIDPPVNECSTTADCREGVCKEHALPHPQRYCEVDEAVDFVLVLPMPDTVYYAPGLTYLLTQDDLARRPVFGAEACKGNCVSVPYHARTEGRYNVTGPAAQVLGGRLVDGGGNELALAQVPMRATYRRLVPGPGGRLVEATSLGLPIEPVVARRLVDESGTPGFGANEPLLSTANLPPGDYLADFAPDPSLRDFVPPRVKLFTVPVFQATTNVPDTSTLSAPDSPDQRRGTIRSAYRSLDGYRCSLVDHDTGRALSRTEILEGSRTSVYLATFNQVDPTDDTGKRLPASVDLVVAPPVDTFLVPTLRTPVIAGSLSEYRYPELPTEPSSLVGTVRLADGTGTRADLEIVSTSIVNLRDHIVEDKLSYTTKVSTDDRGRFETALPEGTYRVFVDPAPASGATRREITLKTKGAETGNPVGARTVWDIGLEPQSVVSGRALLQDERVLGDVEVSFVPVMARTSVSRFELPRPLSVRTEKGTGAFRASLDVGFYDVTVTPVSGTRFAPFVMTDLFVRPAATGPCSLDDFVVKVPRVYPLTLREPNDNKLSWAWARVFARAEGSQHYVEIQRELLDEEGYADLWFRKPELAPSTPCRESR